MDSSNIIINTHDQDSIIREAIQFKKESYRNEIRRRNIQQTLMSKRLNLSIPVIPSSSQLSGNTSTANYLNFNSNNNSGLISTCGDISSSNSGFDTHEITLSTYISTLNNIVSTVNDLPNAPEQCDRLMRCLSVIRSHLLVTVQEQDSDKLETALDEFIKLGGCPSLLQFLQVKYLSTPSIILQAVMAIGNIYTLTDRSILSFFLSNGISFFAVSLLNQVTAELLNCNQRTIYSSQLNQLLCELTRMLANMAGESYEYRMDMIQKGMLQYIQSNTLEDLMRRGISVEYAEQLLFLVKNMVAEKPTINEEYKQKLIPVIAKLFLMSDGLPVEAVQDAILAVKSYAMYGNTILRAMMIANRQVFEKIIEFMDVRKYADVTNVYLAMQTIKDFMKFSERQAQFLFNLKENELLETITWTLSEGQAVDVQISAVEILLMYVSYENQEHFENVFHGSFALIETIIYLAMYHPNHLLKTRAKEFVCQAIQKAGDKEIGQLLQLDTLQVVINTVVQDEAEVTMKLKALAAIQKMVSLDDGDEARESAQIVIRVLTSTYGFQAILSQILGDPCANQMVSQIAEDLMHNYFEG